MQETQETWVQSLSQEDPLEQEMATHSCIFTWKIPQTEEPSRLQSKEFQRVGHDLAYTCAHTHTHTHNPENKTESLCCTSETNTTL